MTTYILKFENKYNEYHLALKNNYSNFIENLQKFYKNKKLQKFDKEINIDTVLFHFFPLNFNKLFQIILK